nr:reverse transcriptase domain-containing protein [Tanacetum cinerariifolium]
MSYRCSNIFDVSTSQNLCDDFAKIMHDEFEMSMMGEFNFFLGLQIKQMEDGIFFNQSKYNKEMPKKFGLEDSKPTKTEADSVDSSKYRASLGERPGEAWCCSGFIERLVGNQSSNLTSSTNLNPKGRNRRRSKQRIEKFNLEELSPPVITMADQPRIWLEKEPPRSIFTWDDLVSKFINQFFHSSKTTSLRNEITNFQQRFDESFSEAWDRFKDLLRACPHHGNFLDKMPRECLAIIECKSKVRYSRDKPVVAKVSTNTSTSSVSPDVVELKNMVKALLLDKKGQNQSPAPVKAVKESCVTCGGAYSYRNCLATDGNNYRDNIQEFISHASGINYNQGNTSYRPPMMSNQIRPPGFPPV